MKAERVYLSAGRSLKTSPFKFAVFINFFMSSLRTVKNCNFLAYFEYLRITWNFNKSGLLKTSQSSSEIRHTTHRMTKRLECLFIEAPSQLSQRNTSFARILLG